MQLSRLQIMGVLLGVLSVISPSMALAQRPQTQMATADESGEYFAQTADGNGTEEQEYSDFTKRWFDLYPFVSVMGGVGNGLAEWGDDYELYDVWGVMIAGQAGVQLPMGLRVSVAFTALPFAVAEDYPDDYYGDYLSMVKISGRIGWGIWLASFYLGAQLGTGPTLLVYEDVRIDDQTVKISVLPEWVANAEWHISDKNFFVCEASLEFVDVEGFVQSMMCGYGWEL